MHAPKLVINSDAQCRTKVDFQDVGYQKFNGGKPNAQVININVSYI